MSLPDTIKVLLIGGPKDGVLITTTPTPAVHFAYPIDPPIRFTDVELMTLRAPLKKYSYTIWPVGREVIRYVGLFEDMDFDEAMSQVLSSYAK